MGMHRVVKIPSRKQNLVAPEATPDILSEFVTFLEEFCRPMPDKKWEIKAERRIRDNEKGRGKQAESALLERPAAPVLAPSPSVFRARIRVARA